MRTINICPSRESVHVPPVEDHSDVPEEGVGQFPTRSLLRGRNGSTQLLDGGTLASGLCIR